jgi:phage tail sheath gpL-like
MPNLIFNQIPGSGLVAPFFTFEVNPAGLYTSSSRLVLLGFKTTAGSMAVNVPTLVTSQQDADTLAGPGSMLREMYRIAAQNAPAQEIWLLAVTESGAAPTWTLTVGAPPAAGGTGVVEICGERVSTTINAGDAAATVATALAAAINAYYNPITGAMLPVTAGAAAAVVTITSRHTGAIMGDIDSFIPLEASNAFAPATRLTIAAGVAGTGNPTLTTPLAALGDDAFDMIATPFADSGSITAYTALLNDTSGRWAWTRQAYGHVVTVNTGSSSAQTTLGLTLNDRHLTVIGRLASPQPSWLWAAGICGRTITWLGDWSTGNCSRNQTGLIVQGLRPPRDRTSWWGYSARNTLVQAGISTWTGTVDGSLAVDKLVTTMRTGAGGQPDASFRDIQSLFQVMHSLRYMRATLANDHGSKAIADDNPGNLGAITTVRDIKATLIHSYEDLVFRGLLENGATFARNLVVQRDGVQPNRVNVYLPLDRVNALDVLAANAVVYAQYPAGM